MKNSRAEVRGRWIRVAYKQLDVETIEWLSGVARALLAADASHIGNATSNARRTAIAAATGLRGTLRGHTVALPHFLARLVELQANDPERFSNANDVRKYIRSAMFWKEEDKSDMALDKSVDRVIADLEDAELRARYRASLKRRSSTRKVLFASNSAE